MLSNSRKEALEKAFGEHGNGLVRFLAFNILSLCFSVDGIALKWKQCTYLHG